MESCPSPAPSASFYPKTSASELPDGEEQWLSQVTGLIQAHQRALTLTSLWQHRRQHRLSCDGPVQGTSELRACVLSLANPATLQKLLLKLVTALEDIPRGAPGGCLATHPSHQSRVRTARSEGGACP